MSYYWIITAAVIAWETSVRRGLGKYGGFCVGVSEIEFSTKFKLFLAIPLGAVELYSVEFIWKIVQRSSFHNQYNVRVIILKPPRVETCNNRVS